MAITADVLLEVKTTKAERQVRQIEKGVDRIASANARILKIDQRILSARKQIRSGSDDAAKAARRRLGILREQRQELTLQKRQLALIEAAETKAAAAAKRRADESKRASAGNRTNLRGAALAGLAPVSIPGQEIVQAGALGAAVAGPKGAALAAAVATVAKGAEALAQFGAASAVAAAEVSKLRIALQGVTGSDYGAAIGAIERASNDFNISISDSTAQFTQLAAATSAAGITFEETEKVYRGLAAANKALGGDAEKLQGILLATTQVFSKGKVTAEELRGQIGERLPGAFSAFAEATGRSTVELDKALERGEVTLRDFVTFAETQLEKYEKQAKKIGDAPEEAGARLKRALDNLQLTIGPVLADIGADFQNLATKIVKSIDQIIGKLLDADVGAANTLTASANLFLGSPVPLENEGLRALEAAARSLQIGNAESVKDLEKYSDAIDNISKSLQYFTRFGADDDRFKRNEQRISELINTLDFLRSSIKAVQAEGFPEIVKDDDAKKEEKKTDNIKKIAAEYPKLYRAIEAGQSTFDVFYFEEINDALEDGNEVLARRLELQRELAKQDVVITGLQNERMLLGDAAVKGRNEGKDITRIEDAFIDNENKLLLATNQRMLIAKEGMREILNAQEEQFRKQQQFNALLAEATTKATDIGNVFIEAVAKPQLELDPLEREIERLSSLQSSAISALEDEIESLIADGVTEGELSDIADQLDRIRGVDIQTQAVTNLEAVDKQRQLNAEVERTNALYNSLGQTIAGGVTSAVEGLVNGSKELNAVLSDVLKQVGMLLIRAGLSAIANDGPGAQRGILSALLGQIGRQEGGAVAADKPYIVGEAGPELFVPSTSGKVVDNKQTESMLMMERYSSGQGVSYQPTFEVVNFGGEEYVTVGQMNAAVREGMKIAAAQGANRGHGRTMNVLQHSRGQRSKLGM